MVGGPNRRIACIGKAIPLFRKQLSLGDRTDLGSYLDKPIQRMTSYSLLLQELMGECSTENTQERRNLRAAMEMVQFQLQHGNDLLAMDAIRECD
ncbi:hypothetical protein chiPu_0030192, partial [Chiloscyllium punctatum]|nr:hypothetical protein [Chiloscyllium punctatum]